MIAYEWVELCEAIRNLAWVPLEEEFGEQAREKIRDARSAKGEIGSTDEMPIARCYALNHSYMHYDALCAAIMCDEMRSHWEEKLVKPEGKRIVHVDFGCGPGTSSWAVASLLGERGFTTIGYDHNANMIQLAGQITSAIAHQCDSNFYAKWDDFNSKVDTISPGIENSNVLVTINHLLNQKSSLPIPQMQEIIRKLYLYSAQTLMVNIEPMTTWRGKDKPLTINQSPYKWNQFKDILPSSICDRKVDYKTRSAYNAVVSGAARDRHSTSWVRACASSA